MVALSGGQAGEAEGMRPEGRGQRALWVVGALTLCLFYSSGLMAPREVLTGNGE